MLSVALKLLFAATLISAKEFSDSPSAADIDPATTQYAEVYNALKCIEDEAPNGPDGLYFNPKRNQATCMIKLLAPGLDASFKRHGMTNKEVALFLSQALPESHFFNQMTESANMKPLPPDCNGTSIALTQMLKNMANDTTGLNKTTSYAGENIGAGILQLTGYDNRISAIDYLVQMTALAKRPAEWKTYWEFPYNGEPKFKLRADENDPKVKAAFLKWYREVYIKKQIKENKERLKREGKVDNIREDIDLNIYGLAENAETMATFEMDIDDPKLGPVKSTALVSELSMAYWHGRCKGDMRRIANYSKAKSDYAPWFPYTSREEYLVSEATACVKGMPKEAKEKRKKLHIADVKKRSEWYKHAKSCVTRNMISNAVIHGE